MNFFTLTEVGLGQADLPGGMMTDDPMYHDGKRQLQDARETRLLADRLEQVTIRTAFTDDDGAFIQRCPVFFIATADAHGHPDCSYKGGVPGFVRVLDDRTLAIPDYDGNGMYRTWGNVLVNPHVGLLFLDFEQPNRIRVNGTAQVREDDPLRTEYPGSVFIVRVTATQIFPNCPRYGACTSANRTSAAISVSDCAICSIPTASPFVHI
jgi:predicted pyridoxine 5'-phosphate oxidase superfamily flavin-nucleotide-binding protein